MNVNVKACCWLLACWLTSTCVAAAEAPLRIVALAPHAVELLYAIGAGDELVAATEHADYPEQAKQLPRIGGYAGIQLDKLLALKPDLVVAWQDGNRNQDIERMQQLGLRVYLSHPQTLAQVADELERLGELTHHQAQATAAAQQYRQQLTSLRRDNAAKRPVKVFYQLWSNPLMTVAGDSWVQQILAVCQADNVFSDAASDYPQVSLENVLLRQPEVILNTDETGNPQSIDWQQWPEIPAVKQQHIITLNADLLQRPTPRAIDGIAQLCSALDSVRQQ